MNSLLVDLFNNQKRLDKLVQGLPVAFEMATREMPKGNPAIGILREHILIGFFLQEYGEENVIIPSDGITRSYDITLAEKPLSIKSISGSGEIKILWTVDPLQIGREIEKYKPQSDIFLVSVNWGKKCDSIFYIPVEVQESTHLEMREGYLRAAVGTNHRGISVSRDAMNQMKNDDRIYKAPVHWSISGMDYTSYERWERFWQNLKI